MKICLSRLLRAAAVVSICAPTWSQITMRVSVDSVGEQANSRSLAPSISTGGQFVVFESMASNLVPGDTNGVSDVFVYDHVTKVTERVSLDSSAGEANGPSNDAELSLRGRYVVFTSNASNLVSGDTNQVPDIFVRDLLLDVTERVNISSLGDQANSYSSEPSISADARWVTFASLASNLASGDTNNVWDVFVHDRQTGSTERVSLSSSGAQGNLNSAGSSMSADGRYVAFWSGASTLVPNDTNNKEDVFVHDRALVVTERVSIDSSGAQTDGDSGFCRIDRSGRFVVFGSSASNLVQGDNNGVEDVFLRDRMLAVTERVSVDSSGAEGNDYSFSGWAPCISSDGRFIVFQSLASNLVPSDTNSRMDVFLRDRTGGVTERMNVDSSGNESLGDDNSGWGFSATISPDGRFVSFNSAAGDLVAADTNSDWDVFVHDRQPCAPNLSFYCTGKVNSAGCTPFLVASGTPSASAGSGFLVDAVQVLELRVGLLFYSIHGPGGFPFEDGFLCVMPPTRRTPAQTSSATSFPPCIGIYSFDFNARIASGIDPALVVGEQVWTQYWTRDSGVPSGSGLTNGLTFVICQ